MRMTRLLAVVAGVGLIAGVLTVLGPTSAFAFEVRDVTKSGWAYTDSRLPDQSFINPAGDAPIGAWTDASGVKHRSRSYFTFDVSRFRGALVHKADLVIAERSAATCATAQPVELWRTDPITPTTTWNSAPRRRDRLGTVLAGGDATCPGYLTWDIRPALQRLADRDESVLTVELRIPHGSEGDLAHGRTLRPFPVIHVEANHAPTIVDIGLNTPEGACGTLNKPTPVAGRTSNLAIRAADVNQFDRLTGQFAAWPVGHEEERTEQFGGSYANGYPSPAGTWRGIHTARSSRGPRAPTTSTTSRPGPSRAT